MQRTRLSASLAAGLLVLSSALFQSCGPSVDDSPYPGMVLVTIDTLRADHLGCYGYARATSPRLDAFAAGGVRFERAVVATPRTTQSLASLLTATTPASHQVRRLEHRLLPEHFTVAERFLEEEFTTGAFVSIPYFRKDAQGFEQGFGEEFDFFAGRDVRAGELTDQAIAWLEVHGDEPFFLWVHYRDPHAPYFRPEPSADFPLPAWVDPAMEHFHYWPIDEEGNPRDPARMNEYRAMKELHKFGARRLPDEDIERGRALYDAEIAYTDHHVGRLLDGLSRLGLEDAVVVVTADHGESLGEHDFWFDHGEFLYDDCLRVPLLVRAPGVPAAVVRTQVGLIDVAPTLLDLFSLEALPDAQGKSFAAALFGHPLSARAYVAESGEPLLWGRNPRFARLLAERSAAPGRRDEAALERETQSPALRQRALCAGSRLKVILDPIAAPGGRIEAYRVDGDPGEIDNAAGDPLLAEEVQRARKVLEVIVEMERRRIAGGAGEAIEADPETARILAECGYVGGR
ncbi:MAG: sulfatase [Planctomycetes bacterium]|nr:sulfatase [Planctomycetota bacterium]